MKYKNQNNDGKNLVNIDESLMDRIDEMPILKQMYGVINDMETCEYNASKEAKKSKKYDQTERICLKTLLNNIK